MSNESWYSAKCIFLHSDSGRGPKQMYEERVILLRADSVDGAIERAEREAEEYCRNLDGCEYLGYVDVFDIHDGKPVEGAEIFSSMQMSSLKPKEYLDLHHPDDPDDCEAIGETHRWHNLDDHRSACYQCKVIRDGHLWTANKRRAN